VAASSTVIAALRHKAGVLIAADSQASDPAAEVRWAVTKCRRIGSVNLVIGFAGSLGSAERIFTALNAANLRPNQLDKQVRFQKALDAIVKPEYEAASQRAYPPRGWDKIAIWGLAATCVEAEPRILELEMSGDSCWHDYFHAIGSGASTAYAIWRTLGGRQLSELSERTALDALLRIIRTAIGVEMMGVAEPVRVWRVSCEAASEIGDDELNAHWQAVDEWEKRDRARLFDADGGGD
jgi:ATP-dependent protease HslVU (ClpYQ) peptidase subunit